MTDFVDPYLDPDVGDLRNLLGARSASQLRALEPQAVFANELELPNASIARTNDLTELCAIHAQLFKGVYDWAGQPRTIDIKKNHTGAEFFLPVGFIDRAASFLFGELADENGLKNLDQGKFIERLAYYYDQLNYIHPFREGNGRTQRVFWTRAAADAGYLTDWDAVVGDENDLASRTAMEANDRKPLTAMLKRIITPI